MADRPHRYDIDPYLWLILIGTFLSCLPGLYLVAAGKHLYAPYAAVVFGVAIFGAAFILSWAAEVAQMDMSQSLAVAILALVAVLPEYAVDFVFTWKAAHDPTQAHYALANMTGANRLLVGLGWPAVLFLYILAKRRREVRLDETQRVEIFYLAMATLYSFTIPLKGSLNLIDTVVLVTLFGLYTRRAAQMPQEEPEMVGPVKIVANAATVPRRLFTALFFLFSGFVIFLVAEPFAHALVESGGHLGIDEFFLVQWLAPIASESPEFIVAATWALRGQAGAALKALISSKVNQWTLLVGTIPLVYAISAGEIRPFVLDVPYGEGPTDVQTHELILTAAQSLFAVAVLVNLVLTRWDGVLLFGLFALQLVWQDIRMEVAAVYIVLAVIWHWVNRRHLLPAARIGLGIR
ncbi:MAG TPA: sodium:calcium antiporter [candidate division Zixibacteria bacterium]|nr:sodium:calcium antiporter [candidate division Zixibacteria bacterium]